MSLLDDPRVYDLLQVAALRHVTTRRLKEIFKAAAGQTVLDVGAGTGNLAGMLPPDATYWALDPDPAKLRRLEHKLPGAHCLQRSAADTGLEDGSVDWTAFITVAHHLDEAEFTGAIAELARITRRRMVFVDPLAAQRWGIQRLILRYDRGSHPRSMEAILDALLVHFELERAAHYRTVQDLFLCVCRPRRNTKVRGTPRVSADIAMT
jgi:ubiquinone/menaquinone biosynthesis C-methylase UbiE